MTKSLQQIFDFLGIKYGYFDRYFPFYEQIDQKFDQIDQINLT